MYDAIVVGAGVMGLSAAVELGRRGQRVVLLDQFAIPNDLGSSHGETRVIRTAYFEHPDYVPLAQRAWMSWQGLGDAVGASSLLQIGGLYLGRPGSALIAGSVEAAMQYGLSHEVWSPAEVRERYAQVTIPDDYVGFFEAQCGVLFASECLGWLMYRALATGVDVRPNQPVTSWEASHWGVTVTAKSGTLEAARLVICAGPWTGEILNELGIPLEVTRQTVGFTDPTDQEPFSSASLPVMCMEARDGAFYYTIPICQGVGPRSELFKVARHDPGIEVTPQTVDRTPNPTDAESFVPGLREFLPGAAGPVAAIDVCLYTNTPDGHFVVDRHPEHENVVLACGFSGHGFKFAPVIGEALADLAIEGKTELPIGFLGVDRFNMK